MIKRTHNPYWNRAYNVLNNNNPRSNPKIYGINVACVEDINPFELKNISVNDGTNHPLDKKK